MKFRYRFVEVNTGEIRTEIFTIQEIEDEFGKFTKIRSEMVPSVGLCQAFWGKWKILSRDRSTELFDKNKIEIFEGDIVRADYCGDGDDVHVSAVRWDGAALTIDAPMEDYDYTAVGWAINKSWEVEIISNIHDNPELLEE